MFRRIVMAVAFLGLVGSAPAAAQQASLPQIPPHAAPLTRIDVYPLPPPGWEKFQPEAATAAYLATVPAADRARSDAYFDGSCWLSGFNLVYTLILAGLFLWSGFSANLRAVAEETTRSRFWQAPLYVLMYGGIMGVAWLPVSFYEDFVREHRYGLSTQSFLGWAGETAIGFALMLFAATVLLTVLYAVARNLRERWWVWGAGVTVAFCAFLMLIQPVFVAPLFNHYAPLPQGTLKTAILAVTEANGVPAKSVYVYDASRQSHRISANVSGLLGTTQVALNDNLMQRPAAEILAVVGHETGHYVMNHPAVALTWLGLYLFVLFALVNVVFRGLADVFGGNWNMRTIADPAGLPLAVALFSLFAFLGQPVTNAITRSLETQADYFGLNAVRQPDAFAKDILHLNDRKLAPSPLQEFWFYDHPSGRQRILTAMRWKKAHLFDADIVNGPVSP